MSLLSHRMRRAVSGVGVGGGVFATWGDIGDDITLSNGDLTTTHASLAEWDGFRANIAITRKTYWEITCDILVTQFLHTGIGEVGAPLSNPNFFIDVGENGFSYYGPSGTTYHELVSKSFGATYDTGHVIGHAFDPGDGTDGKLWWSKNGVWQNVTLQTDPGNGLNPQYSSVTGPQYPIAMLRLAGQVTADFGQGGFAHTPPTGFEGLY